MVPRPDDAQLQVLDDAPIYEEDKRGCARPLIYDTPAYFADIAVAFNSGRFGLHAFSRMLR